MKNIILLIAFFGCFRSAFQKVRCRGEIVGTMDKSFVRKEATHVVTECDITWPKVRCEAVVCFNERAPGYFTFYGCSYSYDNLTNDCSYSNANYTSGCSFSTANFSTVCNNYFQKHFSILECTHKSRKGTRTCEKERKNAEKPFELKYGGYKCQNCFFGQQYADYSNVRYPLYKPATTSNPAENTSESPKPQKGIDIFFSDMDIPLGVPPSAGSGRSTELGIGQHFVMVFAAVALVGTAIGHGILL
ncbi:hypothetical protein niasHT_020320 [Heterodera trifolii]|uniref:Uncharacterized protein n=1 Tax=Heterodera trifolii TaxID=157864 RepID=A0ABD2K464_9BILA